MGAKVLLGALAWITLITGLHVRLNVGWGKLEALLFGRQELKVGFLPVT